MAFQHQPVLLAECIQLLGPAPGQTIIDGTVGGGGHTEAILRASEPDGLVLGIDRDPAALNAARQRLLQFGDRFQGIHGCFGNLEQLLQEQLPVDGLLLDLGVSSPQLDQPDRGFSFRQDGPLDMRMDASQGETVAEMLERIDHAELVRVLREYGEEPRATRIARAILEGRPWKRTVELADCVARASGYRGSRTHPATRTFQALRIAVNDELGELERALESATRIVRPGGRVVVISFHSLEDRMVKRAFHAAAGKGAARDVYGNPVVPPRARLLTRGIAGKKADPDNPRARSARVRAIETLSEPTSQVRSHRPVGQQ